MQPLDETGYERPGPDEPESDKTRPQIKKPRSKNIQRELCNNNCIRKCNTKFSDDERWCIFEQYRKLKTEQRQRDFITNYTAEVINSGLRTTIFYLPKVGERVQVCKTMFINTLALTKHLLKRRPPTTNGNNE